MFSAVIDRIFFTYSVIDVITRLAFGGFAGCTGAGDVRAIRYYGWRACFVASAAMVDVVCVIMALIIAFGKRCLALCIA